MIVQHLGKMQKNVFMAICFVTSIIIKEAACVLSSSPADGVHVAYAKGEGCNTPCDPLPCVCVMQLDGVVYPRPDTKPSFYFAVFEFPSLRHKETVGFATYYSGEADLLITWINDLADSSLIIGCSRDDVSTNMKAEAWLALQSIGMNITFQNLRSGHAMIGFKGDWPRNMRKSKSVSSLTVEVSLTFVLPPLEITPTVIGDMLEVKWKRKGSHFQRYFINATNSFGTGEGDTSLVVEAGAGSAVIGPLGKDIWFSLTMQAPLSTDSDHVIIPSDPYFIVFKGTGGCSTGIFQFLFKIDGNKETFKHGEDIWTKNTLFLPESRKFTGFDSIELKSKIYSNYPVSRICAGMKDLQTGTYSFIEFNMTVRQSMFQWMDNPNGFPTLPSSTWNTISPQGVPTALYCHQGIEVSKNDRKAMLGFLGSSGGVADGCDTKDVVAGYGLKYKSGNYLSAGAIYESGGSKIFKKGFGYILIPHTIDSTWNEWSPWLLCNSSCGTGSRTRSRNSTLPIGDGTKLPPSETNVGSCKIVDCPPPYPQNIVAVAKAKDQIQISWSAVPPAELTGVFGYYEYEKQKQGENTVTLGSSITTYRTIYALQPFTVYCFRVRTILLSAVKGNFSNPACSATEESVPIASPSGIKAFNTSSFCLNVTWTAIPPAQAQGVITKYRIYYTLQSTSATEQSADSEPGLEHTVCGLEPYAKYKVRMSGFTSKGEGPLSPHTTPVSTGEYVPSEAPVIASTQHTSSTSIQVTWSALALHLWRGLPLGYKVFYGLHSTNGASGALPNVSVVSVTHLQLSMELTQLEKYRKYDIWLSAFTVKGDGVRNSSVAEQMTDEDIPVKGPPCTAHNTSAFSINAEWMPLDTEYRLGQLTSYTLFIKDLKTGAERNMTVGSDVLSIEVTNLQPFLNYSFEVAASTSKGMGSRGPPAFALTDEYVPRVGPRDLGSVDVSRYDVQLNWSTIHKDDWQGIPMGFVILYKETTEDASSWKNVTTPGKASLSTVISNLTAYTNYTFRIAGFTVKGIGHFSNDTTIRTAEDAPYVAPGNLTSVTTNTTFCVIRWIKPLESQVKGVIREYKVMYRAVYTASDFVSHLAVKRTRKRRAVISEPLERNQQNITVAPDTFEVAIQGLQGYTNYSIQVLAVTLYEGPASDPIYVFTEETIPAMSPLNVSVTATTYTSLLVKWKHLLPAYAHGIITGYVVYYQHGNHSLADQFNETQVAAKEFLEITHLKIFDWYTVQVAAYTSQGVGTRSLPLYARTGEYVPSKPPDNLTAMNFMHPMEANVSWLPLPRASWRGVPLGYTLVLTAHSAGGVRIPEDKVFSVTEKVSPHVTSHTLVDLLPFYKYELTIKAFTIIGDGPESNIIYVETCQVVNAKMHSSWFEFSPLITRSDSSPVPNGIIPKILSAAIRQCSGRCRGLNINGNASIDYTIDGLGRPAEKANLDDLSNTMTADTEFFFPVTKPTFADDNFRFIPLISPSSVVVVEGKLMENLTGQNVASGMSQMLYVLVLFLLFCSAAGCVIWAAEAVFQTGQFRLASPYGLMEGCYWGWVTATTVGYGDFFPVSVLGRLVAMVWSLVGLVLCGFLSSTMTIFLTASENPLATPSAPATGVGMVLNSWEFNVALKKSMSIDANFTSYSDLLDAVANATIRYGILDASIATVWGPKLAKAEIKVKTVLALNSELGVFASKNASQLLNCFQTYIMEEQSTILREMQAVLEREAALVAKMFAVTEPVDMKVAPTKPEFYSWESQLMQMYVKASGCLLAVLWVFGLIYDICRKWKKAKRTARTATRQPRLTSLVNKGSSGFIEGISGEPNSLLAKAMTSFSEKQQCDEAVHDGTCVTESPPSESANDVTTAELSYHELMSSFKQNEGSIKVDAECEKKDGENGCLSRRASAHSPPQRCGSVRSTASWKEEGILESSDRMECKMDNLSLRSQSGDALTGQQCIIGDNSSQTSMRSGLNSPSKSEPFDVGTENLECNKLGTDRSIDIRRRSSPVDDTVSSFVGCRYHDNDLLERETDKLIQEFALTLEREMNELTERHQQEMFRLQCVKIEHDRKRFGGSYKYFDPYDFITDW